MKNKKSNPKKTFVIAIAGGTGSGKTYIAKKLQEIAPDQIVVISHDNYYKDRTHLPIKQRKFLNYDYPGAFDNHLFASHLQALKNGEAIDMPQYSFKEHVRLSDSVFMRSKPVTLVEGIMILSNAALRKMYDLVIYIDVDDDIRLARRIKRDIHTRQENVETALNQYLESAQPMHDLYTKPGMEYADIIIRNNGDLKDLDEALEVIKARIMEELGICGPTSIKVDVVAPKSRLVKIKTSPLKAR